MSKRHNMVTRLDTATEYTVILMTPQGRQTFNGTAYGKITPYQLKAAAAAKAQAEGNLLLDLIVGKSETHLYGLPKEEYFSRAIILD